MQFQIDPEIVKKFPDLKLGVVVAHQVCNGVSSNELQQQSKSIQERIRVQLSLEDVQTLPEIVRWQEAYRLFGSNPKKFRNSIESLLRRVVSGKDLPSINLLVDIYNLISLKYFIPIGGDDLDKVEGDILLTYAKGDEKFICLGSDTGEIVDAGEVIYRDDVDILCRRWNWREAQKTCMTNTTKNVVLVFEVLHESQYPALTKAVEEAAKLLQDYGRATTKILFLSRGGSGSADLD